jgi:alcohol dehydrogenase class IV
MKPFLFHLPTEVLFGRGRIKEFGARLDPKFERILIATDKNVALKSPAVDAVLAELQPRQVWLFQDIVENPTFENIEEGARFARDLRAEIIIGVGGGSPMDAAKGIALLAANGKDLSAYLSGEKPENPPLPVVCVPTTSGTGSEVTPYAIFTDVENRNKVGYANSSLFPILSIVDPELTSTMPEPVIIHTGLDALTHALESFLSIQAFWMNDILALHVIDVVLWNLKQAVRKDPEAMTKLSYASMLAGINITHGGTILLHIMGYCLTTFHGLPHGKANAALLPHVLDFMRKHSTVKEKVRKLDEIFEPFGGARQFIESFGVSTRLSSYGVSEEELGEFVKRVIVKSDVKITPAPVTEQDIFQIYRSAL